MTSKVKLPTRVNGRAPLFLPYGPQAAPLWSQLIHRWSDGAAGSYRNYEDAGRRIEKVWSKLPYLPWVTVVFEQPLPCLQQALAVRGEDAGSMHFANPQMLGLDPSWSMRRGQVPVRERSSADREIRVLFGKGHKQIRRLAGFIKGFQPLVDALPIGEKGPLLCLCPELAISREAPPTQLETGAFGDFDLSPNARIRRKFCLDWRPSMQDEYGKLLLIEIIGLLDRVWVEAEPLPAWRPHWPRYRLVVRSNSPGEKIVQPYSEIHELPSFGELLHFVANCRRADRPTAERSIVLESLRISMRHGLVEAALFSHPQVYSQVYPQVSEWYAEVVQRRADLD